MAPRKPQTHRLCKNTSNLDANFSFWKVFSQAACVLTLMSFVLKTRNSVSKTRIFALKTRNCAFKMMKFAAQQLLRQASSGHPTRPRYFPTFPAGFSMGKFDQMWDLPLISSMFLLKRQESRGNQPGFVHTYALFGGAIFDWFSLLFSLIFTILYWFPIDFHCLSFDFWLTFTTQGVCCDCRWHWWQEELHYRTVPATWHV